MQQKITPALIARAYADPLSWTHLAVDLLPLIAVLQFGWGATPLVALYWLENLIIGAFAIARILGIGIVQFGWRDPGNLAAAIFMAAFFCAHYGAFCWGHGLFIANFADQGFGLPGPLELIGWAMGTGPQMQVFLAAIILAATVTYIVDFVGRGDIARVTVGDEMAAPYGRIVTLHVAIILGAAWAFSSDDPLLGVLLLILVRVVFGILGSVRRRQKRDRALSRAGRPPPHMHPPEA